MRALVYHGANDIRLTDMDIPQSSEADHARIQVKCDVINLRDMITSVRSLERGPEVFAKLASGRDIEVVLHPA